MTVTAAPVEPGKGRSHVIRGRVLLGWKSLVLIRALRLREEAGIVSVQPAENVAPHVAERVFASVDALLHEAEETTSAKGWRAVIAWFTGAEIERAWVALHQADELLYLVRNEDSIRARSPELLAGVRARIDRDDPRRAAFEATLTSEDSEDREDRELLRAIRRNLNEISDDAHSRVRSYRNVVLTFTIFLTVGMIILAFDAPSKPWLPVAHGTAPWPTIWQIELVGALGGLLAGITSLRALEGFAGPYALPLVMAMLKIPAGALTGLLGALWMQNGVFTGIAPQDGLKILAYVALFGFAQQALTTFADKQAGQLLGQAKGTTSGSQSGASP